MRGSPGPSTKAFHSMVSQKSFKIISLLFFFSGFAALCYQIVWTRLLLYTFGNTTYSVVAVLAAFMAGLGLGGYLFGKYSHKFTNPLKVFGLIELGIGIVALLTPVLFLTVNNLYLWILNSNLVASDTTLVLVKFIATCIAILPATTLMGGTFPIVLSSCLRLKASHPKLTGRLYGVNTLGAICGALFTAFIAIEIFGLKNTVYLTVLVNIAIFISTILIPSSTRKSFTSIYRPSEKNIIPLQNYKTSFVIILYGLSGITSMALEVLWIRLLAPLLGTYIYAFSLILVTFLSGLMLGSFMYGKYASKITKTFMFLGLSEFVISLSAFFSIIIISSGVLPHNAVLQTIMVVFPGTFAMGTILPAITSLSKREKLGSFIGKALFFNSLGSTLGPIIAGFVLISTLGSTRSVLVISAVTSLIAALLFLMENKQNATNKKRLFVMSTTFSVLIITLILSGKDKILSQRFIKHQKALHQNENQLFYEDEVATVFAYSSPDHKKSGLIIDGIETTRLVSETKLIAHLPLFIHPHPKKVLIIALGMGTTFRSSLTHDVEKVDVVELVPSVSKMFSLFHPNSAEVLKDPRGKIIINDGRQYVHTTKEKYDVVTIDPPPPVNSAGTTVLYSQELYREIKQKLNDSGVVQQWFFFDTTTTEREMMVLVRSFSTEFEYALVFRSPNNLGISVIGSQTPLEYTPSVFSQKLKNTKVFNDLSEWENTPKTSEEFDSLYLGNKDVLTRYVLNQQVVTDNYPRTEYFLLNRLFGKSVRIDNIGLTNKLQLLAK